MGGEQFDIRNVGASKGKVFHVTEVVSYYRAVIKFYLKKGAIKQAKTHLAYLLNEPLIGGENEKVRALAEFIIAKQIEERKLLIEKALVFEPEASFPTVKYER